MKFEADTIYHIYNQGNNREPIFFKDENYLFFLRKMRDWLLPYGDMLCYCLMPNHFHWLFYVRTVALSKSGGDPSKSGGDWQSPPDYGEPDYKPGRSLNDSIAILLRSYTRAINIQENRSGSLFRKETKAKDGWIDGFITLDTAKGLQHFWNDYGSICFNYIHNNPVEAKLVQKAEDWLYSSAMDFAGLRNGTLCNRVLAKELLNLP